MELKGRVALVTGGATGLGREIVAALAARGASIGIGYGRSGAEALQAVVRARQHGVEAEAFPADLSRAGDAERLVNACAEHFRGRLDMLINSAGTTAWIPFAQVKAVDDATWDRILAVNLTAPFACARAASDLLAAQNGAIVNVASLAGLAPRGSSIPYSVSKAALIHLTLCLAAALAPRVRVNAVAPGDIATDWAARTGRPEHPSTRPTLPTAEVVRAVMTLLESDGSTGQVVTLDPQLG
ncbi:MAG: SDR family NAD(P)-dependent oxidoreductase [Chloroflexi bacterium]|nr:SDR family NAD(P)-dependent oxidoreductase [Chloroflexota bacterium]